MSTSLGLMILMNSGLPIEQNRPPNIVVILVDDLGQRDIAPYGSTFYETPNLTRLAQEGAIFSDAYAACPVCSPSRVALLTGRYPQRAGLTDYAGSVADPQNWKVNTRNLPAPTKVRLELGEVTIAEIAKRRGYDTFFAGKWHVGGSGFLPTDQGFDFNLGGLDRGGPYSGKQYFSPYDNPYLPDGPDGEQIDNRLGMETAKFIGEHKNRPFLVLCSTYGVHTPLMAKPELVAKYRAKRQRLGIADQWIQDGFREVRQTQDHAVYAGMVETVDESVGMILDSLHKHGLENNTVVIFTSDNGGLSTSEGWPTSNLPLRGGKGWMYEGGIRVPFIVRWPGVTKPGSTLKSPAASIDILPTIRALVGDQSRRDPVDGLDLRPLITASKPKYRDLFWAYPHYGNQGGEPASAIRRGKWKLIEFEEDGRQELYDLSIDLGEKTNLRQKEPGIANQLFGKLAAWKRQVGAIRSTPNPAFDPAKVNGRSAVRQKSN